MTFGKRFSIHNNRPARVTQQACPRCCGTGRIRERGHSVTCKACAGTGRTKVTADRRA